MPLRVNAAESTVLVLINNAYHVIFLGLKLELDKILFEHVQSSKS